MNGKTIRRMRERHGLTQRALADLLGQDNYTTVQSWELGSRAPSKAACAALKMIDAILTTLAMRRIPGLARIVLMDSVNKKPD